MLTGTDKHGMASFGKGLGKFLTLTGTGNRAGAGYMLVAIVGLSFMPVTIAFGDGGNAPFLFNAWLRLGFVAGCTLFLVSCIARLKHRREILALFIERIKGDMSGLFLRNRTLKQRLLSAALLLCMVSNFDFALFAWSVKYVDVSVAAVLYEIWPIGIIFLTALLIRNRYASINITTVLLLVICFVGVAFVISSQSDVTISYGNFDTVIGVFLVISAVAVTSLATFGFRWGNDMAEIATVRNLNENHNTLIDLLGVIFSYNISSIIAIPVNFVIGVTSMDISVFDLNALFITIGGIILAFSAICLRQANIASQNLGVNAIAYGTPIFSLIWLFALSQANVLRVDYLVIGTAAIAVANLLINFEAERLLGFKALVLAIWACGAVVYLRDAAQSQWAGVGTGYFEALALSATVFTLLLSFRVVRLASRTRDEDNRTFTLFYELQALSERGLIDLAVCDHILTIDSSQGAELQNAYAAARGYIAAALRQADSSDRERLVAAQSQLDALAHSRQQGINFGELCALFIFAGITVGLALFLRPVSSGLTAFLVEMFTMLFSSVIVFLAVNVIDLQMARNARILRRSDAGDYALVFEISARRHIEQGITIAVGIAIVAAYAGLLGYKWLGWFG